MCPIVEAFYNSKQAILSNPFQSWELYLPIVSFLALVPSLREASSLGIALLLSYYPRTSQCNKAKALNPKTVIFHIATTNFGFKR